MFISKDEQNQGNLFMQLQERVKKIMTDFLMRVEPVAVFFLHSALKMSFDAIKEPSFSVFPEKSKYKEVYLLRDTIDQWLVSKYTIAIVVSAPHLQ